MRTRAVVPVRVTSRVVPVRVERTVVRTVVRVTAEKQTKPNIAKSQFMP